MFILLLQMTTWVILANGKYNVNKKKKKRIPGHGSELIESTLSKQGSFLTKYITKSMCVYYLQYMGSNDLPDVYRYVYYLLTTQ